MPLAQVTSGLHRIWSCWLAIIFLDIPIYIGAYSYLMSILVSVNLFSVSFIPIPVYPLSVSFIPISVYPLSVSFL